MVVSALTYTNIPSTFHELQRNCGLGGPREIEACVTAGIGTLMKRKEHFTHEVLNVGCRRLWARVFPRLQTLCHCPTHFVMQVGYLLLGRGI
jgi:hypothetical protein